MSSDGVAIARNYGQITTCETGRSDYLQRFPRPLQADEFLSPAWQAGASIFRNDSLDPCRSDPRRVDPTLGGNRSGGFPIRRRFD